MPFSSSMQHLDPSNTVLNILQIHVSRPNKKMSCNHLAYSFCIFFHHWLGRCFMTHKKLSKSPAWQYVVLVVSCWYSYSYWYKSQLNNVYSFGDCRWVKSNDYGNCCYCTCCSLGQWMSTVASGPTFNLNRQDVKGWSALYQARYIFANQCQLKEVWKKL